MSDVVFILGAGASKRAGAPLMGNFLDVASDLLRLNKVDAKREQFERIFKVIGGLQAVHSKSQLDLTNIESIFTALELGKIIQKVPGTEVSEIPEAIAALKDVIVSTLEATIHFPTQTDFIRAPSPYEAFGTLVKYLLTDAAPRQTVSVLSFNYDICADVALYRAGFGPHYVIEPPPQTLQLSVDLLKLHGSLNWATETGSGRIRPLHIHNLFQTYRPSGFETHSLTRLAVGEHLVQYFSKHSSKPCEVEAEPVIVPPSWNKADYHLALSNVWAHAAKHLAEAESIFIIGYSLPETDSFFRHLYALGSVGKSALRRIVVFNPDNTGATDQRFKALLGPGSSARYQYFEKTFEESIPLIKEYFPERR